MPDVDFEAPCSNCEHKVTFHLDDKRDKYCPHCGEHVMLPDRAWQFFEQLRKRLRDENLLDEKQNSK